MISRKDGLFCASILLVVGTILSCGSSAAPQTVAEIANYVGADRQTLFEAAAKKEGTVQVYTVGTQTDPLFKRFGELYPDIRVQVLRAPSTQLVRRAYEEARAERHVADVFGASVGAMQQLRTYGLFQPLASPESRMFKQEAVERDRNWVVDYNSYLNFSYSPKHAPEAADIKTYDDLLDPRWKGKMTVSGWTSTTAYWVGAVILAKGEDFLRKLAQQQFTTYEMSPRAVANLIISGEAPISPVVFNSHVNNSKSKGASIEWKALGPTYSNAGGVGISKKAPHPHAAMLLVDFMLSREAQTMRQGLGYNTPRNDLRNPDGQPDDVIYLVDRPTFEKDFEYWSDLAARIFGKGQYHKDGGSPTPE